MLVLILSSPAPNSSFKFLGKDLTKKDPCVIHEVQLWGKEAFLNFSPTWERD